MENFIIERAGGRPIYEQLLEEFRSCALKAEPGTPMPSENTVCRKYGIARMTVSRAFNQLVQEGVLYRERGRGTFVCKREQSPVFYLIPCQEALREQLPTMRFDVYYGARRRAAELGVMVDTIPASQSNWRTDMDEDLLRRLPPGSAVIVNGLWFNRIFPILVQKQCRVGFISTQVENTFCFESTLANWQVVEIDRRRIMRQVIRHLKAQGCRHIAFFHAFTHAAHPFREGFRAAMAAEQLDFPPEMEWFVDDKIKSACEYAISLLDMSERYPCDAVITGTVNQAIGVFQAFRDLRLNIPRDICLVSLGDDKILEDNTIPISAVECPYGAVGELILEKIVNPDARPGKVVLPCRLQERMSSCRIQEKCEI